MSEIFSAFGKIAQYLRHPLVLVGFGLMLFFNFAETVLIKLLESKILPQFTAKQGSDIVENLLSYGFWLGVLTTSLGFTIQFYKLHVKKKELANVEKIVATLTDRHHQDLQTKDEQIKALTQAVSDLSKGQGVFGTEAQIEQAMSALAEGDTTEAENLFEQVTQKGEQEAKHTAQAYRNLGALAYLHDTQKALNAYRRATELDPDNAEGWNQLGILLFRIGELDEAIKVYKKILTLGDFHRNQYEVAVAYGNLGNVYKTKGNLDKAIEYCEKALNINKILKWEIGMATQYCNLGILYQLHGESDKSFEFHAHALKIHETLDIKEGMANGYCNLGIMYQLHGKLDKAVEFHRKSLAVNEILGCKEVEANGYCNLGLVYQMRREFDEAIEFYKKALFIHGSLNIKESMANDCCNLGNTYKIQGNKTEAKRYYQMSIELFKQIGSPYAQEVQASLDALQ